jgi:hypothetical protein
MTGAFPPDAGFVLAEEPEMIATFLQIFLQIFDVGSRQYSTP